MYYIIISGICHVILWTFSLFVWVDTAEVTSCVVWVSIVRTTVTASVNDVVSVVFVSAVTVKTSPFCSLVKNSVRFLCVTNRNEFTKLRLCLFLGHLTSGMTRQGNLRFNEERFRADADPLNIYKERYYERRNAERSMHIRNACTILWRHDQ